MKDNYYNYNLVILKLTLAKVINREFVAVNIEIIPKNV
jgi:hypothetical protein